MKNDLKGILNIVCLCMVIGLVCKSTYSYSGGKSATPNYSFGKTTSLDPYEWVSMEWNYDLERLDSLYKRSFSAVLNGVPMDTTYYEFDSDKRKWAPLSKVSYHPGAGVPFDSITTYMWDIMQGRWVWDSKSSVTWKNGQMDSISTKGNGEWLNLSTTADVVIFKRRNYYDGNGKLKTSVSQLLDMNSEEMVGNDSLIYSWNTDGKIATKEICKWDTTASKMIQDSLYTYTYDGKGQLTEIDEKVWSTFISQYEKSRKEQYGYDATGLRIAFAHILWSGWKATYITPSIDSSVYDNNGNILQKNIWLDFTYDGAFLLYRKKEYTYDSLSHVPLSITTSSTPDSGQTWEIEGRELFRYKKSTVGISMAQKEVDYFIVYPVPAQGLVNIHAGIAGPLQFEVFDLLGKRLTVSIAKNDSDYSLDLSRMENGIYFLKISGEEGVVLKKLCIQH